MASLFIGLKISWLLTSSSLTNSILPTFIGRYASTYRLQTREATSEIERAFEEKGISTEKVAFEEKGVSAEMVAFEEKRHARYDGRKEAGRQRKSPRALFIVLKERVVGRRRRIVITSGTYGHIESTGAIMRWLGLESKRAWDKIGSSSNIELTNKVVIRRRFTQEKSNLLSYYLDFQVSLTESRF
ncbi:hypothetical protein Tco_0754904 [Tanacetum coccineum]